jgi:hypothetical protein
MKERLKNERDTCPEYARPIGDIIADVMDGLTRNNAATTRGAPASGIALKRHAVTCPCITGINGAGVRGGEFASAARNGQLNKIGRSDFQAAPKEATPMRWDCGRDHADFLARLFAASSASRSVEAQPLAANVAHWSLGILSRNIQERTVCGETEHTEATVSSSPALLTIDA